MLEKLNQYSLGTRAIKTLAHRTSAITASLLCLSLPAATAASELGVDIDNSRVLAACPSQPNIYEGISPKIDWIGFEDRDLVILELVGAYVHTVSVEDKKIRQITAPQKESERLRQMADCRTEDKYVLIGKDGGVKRRWRGGLRIDDLFQTIDAMPMRQFEMRQQATKR